MDCPLIDLHIHSTASDGSLSPADILTLAKSVGVKAISITDHDTIDGIKEVLNHPLPSSLACIPGVEISCSPPPEFKNLGSIHMLGYGFSVYDRGLNTLLENAKKARTDRNPQIIEKLKNLGFDISMARVEARFGADQTGRPHIAEFMKENGYVTSFKEAFDKYLGKDKPAYVNKFKVSCQSAIETIHQAGGLAVLAHPGLLTFQKTGQDKEFIDILAQCGLDGMEVFYSDHSPERTQYYKDMASEKGLIVTGGSDFHGSFNKGVELGTGKDNLRIDYSVYTRLIRRLEKHQSMNTDLKLLQDNIGYGFADLSLLEHALCHRSFLNENQDECASDNERLEFLGDAVVDLCIAQTLMEKSPLKKEGELSKLRSSLVSEPGLARIARAIDLGRFIRLGKGERLSRGFEKNSILSDAFEAVVAAIYLDSDFDTVHQIIRRLFASSIHRVLSRDKGMDYKSMLQEYSQEQGGITPKYQVFNEIGPDHDKTFEIRLDLFDIQAKGFGKTKKAAEQDAARKALKGLGQIDL